MATETRTPEEEEEVKKLAKAKGLVWSELTDDQKEDLYLDYEGLRDVSNVEYASGSESLNMAGPQGREVGGIYAAANPLEHIATALRRGVGGVAMKKAKGDLGKLSSRQAAGRATAGGLAAQETQDRNEMLKQIFAGQQKAQQPVQQPQGAGPVVQQQGAPLRSAGNPPPSLAPRPQPQMASGGNVPGNPAEWNQYIKGGKVGQGGSMEAEAIRRRKEEEMMRMLGRG